MSYITALPTSARGISFAVAEATKPTLTWIGPADLLTGRKLAPVSVGARHMILVRNGTEVVLTERSCPHEGADLMTGRCADGRLFCPRHLASFELISGQVSAGWCFRNLLVYPVRCNGGQLWGENL